MFDSGEGCALPPSTAVMGACLKPGKLVSSPGTLVPHQPQGHKLGMLLRKAGGESVRGIPEQSWTGCHVVAGVPLRLQRSKSCHLYAHGFNILLEQAYVILFPRIRAIAVQISSVMCFDVRGL